MWFSTCGVANSRSHKGDIAQSRIDEQLSSWLLCLVREEVYATLKQPPPIPTVVFDRSPLASLLGCWGGGGGGVATAASNKVGPWCSLPSGYASVCPI